MAADCRMNLRRVEKRDGLVFMMFLEQYGQRRVPCQYKSPGRLQEHQPTDPPDRDDPWRPQTPSCRHPAAGEEIDEAWRGRGHERG
jgi:hypothetical protein